MSFSIFWICSASKPASSSFFFCSSVNLNSVAFSVVVADLSCTADSFAIDEDFSIACAFDCAATSVSAFVSSTIASSLGCSTSSPVLASFDSTLASSLACGVASTFSANVTFGVMNIM